MEQTPSNSGTHVRHDAKGRRVECISDALQFAYSVTTAIAVLTDLGI